jgi:thiol-disulfide isomerase/thioredoxin
MRRRPGDFAWIPLVLLLAVPVALSVRTGGGGHSMSGGGALIYGLDGMDSLLADWRGLPVIVNFWATWCTPCVGELPLLDSLSGAFAGKCRVVAVDIGDPDSTAVEEFLATMPLGIPVVWLDESGALAVRSRMGLPPVVPLTLFLDASGLEIARVSGARSYAFFSAMAESLSLRGTVGPETAPVADEHLHVNVVGPPGDSLTSELLEAAFLAAGESRVTFFDPTDSADLARLDRLFLPVTGWPYAQPCIGSTCGRPVRTPGDLLESVELLEDD